MSDTASTSGEVDLCPICGGEPVFTARILDYPVVAGYPIPRNVREIGRQHRCALGHKFEVESEDEESA